jgi:hypothetical protein
MTALRTYVENEVREAQQFVAFSKRDKKSAFSVLADQKFFQAGNSLASRWFLSGEKSRGQPGI